LRRGDRNAAREAWARAVDTLEPIARTSRDYAFLEPWALALAGAGRPGEAREVVRRLEAIGYRDPALSRAFTGGEAREAAVVPR
jgi:hypothetical protein